MESAESPASYNMSLQVVENLILEGSTKRRCRPALAHVSSHVRYDYVSGRSSSISRHQRTRGAPLLLSATHYSNHFLCFQHESWPRFTPLLPPRPLPRPTFNLSSMLPSRHMRKRQSASFSLILLPPSCSPATPPSPFYPSFKTLSSNSITVAAVMRD